MKIGLVCPYNMFRGGGVQEVVLALRDGIAERGHEVRIITPRPREFKDDAPEGIIFIGSSMPFRAARTQGDIAASGIQTDIKEILENEKFDLIHFHEPWNPMLSFQLMSRSQSIHIATFHAAMSERRTSRAVERVITPYTKSIIKYIDVMTAVSKTATNYVRTLTNRQIAIIGNGIDLQKYKPLPKQPGHKELRTIFYVGRLEKRKGLLYLIEAFALLQKVQPNFELIIAGDGPERERLQQVVRENKIKHVKFLGYIDEETKLKYLRESDLFCSPALYGESFGIVLLEAMASGCVTVCGNNTGYEGVMKGRGQLSLVNPKDTVEFARRLSLLANDQELRKAWKDWALSEAKKYDYENIVDQYVSLYEAAYAKKRKQPETV